MNRTNRTIITYALLACLVLYLISQLSSWQADSGISYSRMLQLFEQEQVSSFVVRDNEVTMQLSEPTAQRSSSVPFTALRSSTAT